MILLRCDTEIFCSVSFLVLKLLLCLALLAILFFPSKINISAYNKAFSYFIARMKNSSHFLMSCLEVIVYFIDYYRLRYRISSMQ